MSVIERDDHYVCPQCGCADMRETAKFEAVILSWRDAERECETLRQQLQGAVDLLRTAVGCEEDACDGPTGRPMCQPCIGFARAHVRGQ
jgi:hypothetical protein